MFGKLTDKPSELFKRQVRVVPFFEEDLNELIVAIGAQNVLAGSDFPHPEGLAEPPVVFRGSIRPTARGGPPDHV